MVTNGVPTTIVEKLLDNLKELTKNVSEIDVKTETLQDTVDESAEKVAAALTKVAERLHTPPRHEELDKGIKDLSQKLDTINKCESEQNDLLKSVIKTIKIAAGLFSLAILIATIMITVVDKTKSPSQISTKIENVEKQLQDHIQQKPQK